MKKISRWVLQLSLLVFLGSCANLDETLVTETPVEEAGVLESDAWICDMKSFEDDAWRYSLHMDANGDYTAVSDARILKVDKYGTLTSMVIVNYPDDDFYITKAFNDKIYRFHTDNDFQDYDPNQPIELAIYDLDFNLMSEHVLDSKGIMYDVEIESDNVFAILSYNVDTYEMTLKKFDLVDGLLAEILLGANGTSPTNLHLTEDGYYFCTASSNKNNLYLLDDDLNLIWGNEYDDYVISDAEYVEGRGIFITGRVASFFDPERPAFVALIDVSGNELNSVLFDPGERWSPYMKVNKERICLVQTEPESGLNMLYSILDFDLTIERTIEIQGNVVQSDIIVNENDSFSFVYGIAVDPSDPDFFPTRNTRIFKFDETYELPTNVIVQ